MKHFLRFSFVIIISFLLSGCESRLFESRTIAPNFRERIPKLIHDSDFRAQTLASFYEVKIDGVWYKAIPLLSEEYLRGNFFGPIPEFQYELGPGEADRLRRNQGGDSGGDGGGDSGW